MNDGRNTWCVALSAMLVGACGDPLLSGAQETLVTVDAAAEALDTPLADVDDRSRLDAVVEADPLTGRTDDGEPSDAADGADGADGGDGLEVSEPGPVPNSLQVDGRWFRDRIGRVVLLRGVNVAGNSKVPPFVPITALEELDPLEGWGMNVIRLLFVWEAYEAIDGVTDEAYLDTLVTVAQAAWARGLRVIVDFHQDGFSRYLAGGCGDGFPLWAIAPTISTDTPDNGSGCALWAAAVASDPGVHDAFNAFYADTYGVRTRYLSLLGKLAATFSHVEGVIGYDLLNEPWGWDSELGALYEDAAVAIRSEHPDAILFVEGHASTNGGLQTTMPKPTFDNFAYAPHFYDGIALAAHAWAGVPTLTDAGYAAMEAKASEWGVPLFVGEFGMHATALNAAGYVDLNYARLNQHLASGAQWNYTPGWSPTAKDGWNAEDLSIVDDQGQTRANFKVRPFPHAVAGTPTGFALKEPSLLDPERFVELQWDHVAGIGLTEVFLGPEFSGAAGASLETTGDVECDWDAARVICASATSGPKTLRVVAP